MVWIKRLPLSRSRLGLAGLLLLAVVLLVSIPQLPSLRDQERDSGIFAYTAKVIVNGGQPYEDAWDNKPPGVYYINALSFVLFGFNRWALWLAELAFTIMTTAACVWFLRSLVHRWVLVVAGTVMFLLMSRNPAMVGDGNFTESYALLPQVVCFAAGYQFLRDPKDRWAWLIGISAGLVFLIKQTSVGVAITFIPAILLTRHTILTSPQRWRYLGIMILGGMGTLGLTAVYLAVNGVLPEAFDATIVSPSMLHEWISREPLSRWEKFNLSLRADPFVYVLRPLIPFFLIGLIWGGKALIRPATSARTTLILWLVLTFALDFYLTNLTGRAYFHYYVTPTLALAALTLLELATLDRLKTQRRLYHLAWVAGCLYIAGVNVTYLNAFAERIDESEGALIGESIEDPLALYVEAHTLPEDTILVWGASSNIYFQSDRESATQYHYAYPLIVPEYTDPEQIAEVVADLESHRPVMIVDSAITDGDRVPPLNAYFRAIWWTNGGRRDTADLQPIYDFVTDHCLITEMIYGAVIFRCEYR